MKVVCQKVTKANVKVNNKIVTKISNGLLILVGFTTNDNQEKLNKMASKILSLRIFNDLSIKDINGEILVVSQFTLYANTSKGNRPSYSLALNHQEAKILYDKFCDILKESNLTIKTGIFRENMQVTLTNDGPTTIIIEN